MARLKIKFKTKKKAFPDFRDAVKTSYTEGSSFLKNLDFNMEKILKNISKSVVLLNEIDLTDEQKKAQWLGFAPATDVAIEAAEKRLNCSLPTDYKEFLRITNGFSQTNNAVHSTFLPVEKIDFLINLDDDLIEIWEDTGNVEVGKILRTSILIGGLNESQHVLLIPQKNKWIYWQFAHWIPGERPYKNLASYFKSVLDLFKDDVKNLKKQKPKEVIDYSLREAVFNFNWQAVYDISSRFILENKPYYYYNTFADLYALMLLATSRLGNQKGFVVFLKNIPQIIEDERIRNDYLIQKYIGLAENSKAFFEDLQELNRFKPQQNPKGLTEIEAQIKTHRKDLLKEKNGMDKVNYQLFFLFDFGNTEGSLGLFEMHENEPNFYPDYLKIATIYASLGNKEKGKNCLEKYQKDHGDFRPFEPYLNEELLKILENTEGS
jgi:cell wall assembly regulator SMI1